MMNRFLWPSSKLSNREIIIFYRFLSSKLNFSLNTTGNGIRVFSSKPKCSTCFAKRNLTHSTDGELNEYLLKRISAWGPLTISQYMAAVLTHPKKGYYMQNNVFGKQGDFTTSPEISQMFGELLAVWILHEWVQIGCPKPFQIVELGPGRGTLADDILRVFSQLKHIPNDALSLHLVEISSKMRQMQLKKLNGSTQTNDTEVISESISKTGIQIRWHDSLLQVPKGPSCFVAHEFFDALPIHKFQKTSNGWREVMVDIDNEKLSQLRFVISPTATPTSTIFTKASEVRDHVEVCPQAGIVIQELADRISTNGGMALIVDYGHDGDKTDTLRAFKDHKLHDVLTSPGTADLTADVDFKYLKDMAANQVSTYGPVCQGIFLQMMGIQQRLQVLMKNSSANQQKDLLSGYKMLTDPGQMGERFKMFAIFPHLKNHTPAGFPVTK